jgi:microcystin-dependent protein
MFRIAGAGTVQDARGHNQFTHEDAQTQRPPTEITDKWLNDIQEEIAGAVEGMGAQLSADNNNQLLSALNATFAAKSTTIHHIRDIWQIVDNLAALDALTDVPDGAEVIVTDRNGAGHGLAYYSGGEWNVQPITVSSFDLYGTTFDGHGYYWFADNWRIFDIESLEAPPATEDTVGIMRAATYDEVLNGSLLTVAVKPRYLADYMDSMLVGMIADFGGLNPGAVWIPASGQIITRASRPRLWMFANSGGNIVDDSQWGANTGKFSHGDGDTTFRLPDLRGEFRRGWDNGRGLDVGRQIGSRQTDAIQNITGGFSGFDLSAGTGAFSVNSTTLGTGPATGTSRTRAPVTFDASKSVRTSTETRPHNVAYPVYIYAGMPVQ